MSILLSKKFRKRNLLKLHRRVYMNQLQVVKQKMVPFGDVELLSVKMSNGKIYAAVKWVCVGIGLSDGQAKRQVENLGKDIVLNQGVANLRLPTNGGTQEVLCIELDYLPLWLAKISITPSMQQTNPLAVKNLVNYQLKAKDVLAEAFLPKQQPRTQAELIAMMAQHNVEQERRLNEVEQRQNQLEAKQDNITEIIALNPTEWRKKVSRILSKIAESRGGFEAHKQVRNESYELLEERARCKLNIRIANKQKNLLLTGVGRSAISKVSKIDVIADDTRLIEIYLAIVKEMAIKYGVKAEGLGA